jgi:hypothetical protein
MCGEKIINKYSILFYSILFYTVHLLPHGLVQGAQTFAALQPALAHVHVGIAGGPRTVQQRGQQAVPVGGQVRPVLPVDVLDGGQLGILLPREPTKYRIRGELMKT